MELIKVFDVLIIVLLLYITELVSWGYHNKMHKMGGASKRNIFLTILEAGKPKNKMPADSVPDESSLPGFQIAASLLYSYVANTERGMGRGREKGVRDRG